MHGKTMRYLLVAAAALVAGLLLAGTRVQALLPILLLLACPLMMVLMMRGMGGHGVAHNQNPVLPERHDVDLREPLSHRAGSRIDPEVLVDQRPHDRQADA